MSIKSDRWIRKMAEEHGMIEPFEAGQVRFNDVGERLVSYGTSSYGYDVRCAPEFKVFTNVHSVVVDPKNFDEKVLLISSVMSASFRPTLLHWHAPWNISVFHVTY